MEITKEQISEINNKVEDAWNEGLYTTPWGIDVKEKRLVIYQRINTGGEDGNSKKRYANPETTEKLANWQSLDEFLSIFAPNITYLQYKRLVHKLAKTNEETQYDYYGYSKDFFIRWIVVDELFSFLEKNNIK